ncbi:mas-related G-protein coupled receptor member H-like [Zootoca vivipara]|uniref:mas-related G-protein coupled receptor member H-like n=1 Tax=Zootoca vivipara TaxID=8524 RepID=UPI0015928E51|nr:mas-related G-protein coupled receptor member H-like [Zootoca vivipara]
MANFIQPSLPHPDVSKGYPATYNGTELPNNATNNEDPGSIAKYNLETLIFFTTTLPFIVFGLWGNGTVIWLLGVRIKRNTFSTYIVNLSAADIGLLIVESILLTYWSISNSYRDLVSVLFNDLFLFMYSAGQFLLTVISIDRCLSVLFPLWYRCHRPTHLSSTVSALLWILSLLLPAIHFTLFLTHKFEYYSLRPLQIIINGTICLPLLTISTLTLFIKVYFKSQPYQRGKRLVAILLTLLFFLIFSFPLNVFHFMKMLNQHLPSYIMRYGYFCACLNSSVNPLIYFLVGRQRRDKTRRSMESILKKIFVEEGESREELET